MSSPHTSFSSASATHRSHHNRDDYPPPYWVGQNPINSFAPTSDSDLLPPREGENEPAPGYERHVNLPSQGSRWSADSLSHPVSPTLTLPPRAVISIQPLCSLSLRFSEGSRGEALHTIYPPPLYAERYYPASVAWARHEHDALARYDFDGRSFLLLHIYGEPIHVGGSIHFFIDGEDGIRRGRGTVTEEWKTGNPSLVGFVMKPERGTGDVLLLVPVPRPEKSPPLYTRIPWPRIPCIL
jgi:hypothetical protein